MTGGVATVSRVTADGVYVRSYPTLPGQELGPLKALVHRVVIDTVEYFTEYAEGDIVEVVEISSNEFIVLGIVEPAA